MSAAPSPDWFGCGRIITAESWQGFTAAYRASAERRRFLVAFHKARGWLNCSHKSDQRLEAEYAAIMAAETRQN